MPDKRRVLFLCTENACLHFYKCEKCQKTFAPTAGSCCVICAYSDKNCPMFVLEVIRLQTGEEAVGWAVQEIKGQSGFQFDHNPSLTTELFCGILKMKS